MAKTFTNDHHTDFNTTTVPPVYANQAGPDQEIPRFTATGRPFTPAKSKSSSSHAIMIAESMGVGPAELLPRRYNDNSIINIPVLPPGVQLRPLPNIASSDEDAADDGPVKHDKNSGFKFWRSNSSGKKTEPKKKITGFVMKDVTRGEYLKHYAKDDDGKYIGSEDPAADCILRHQGDLLKWRSGTSWSNDM